MNDIYNLIAERTKQVKPISVEYKEPNKNVIKLDTNENLFINPTLINKIVKSALEDVDIRYYPPPMLEPLLEAFSRVYNVSIQQVLAGNGADNIIEVIMRTFLNPGENIIITPPTFGVYSVAAKYYDAHIREVPLNEDFSLNEDNILNAIDNKTKIIFLCTPNNPTGNQFITEKIIKLIEESNKIVVLDETYADFSGQSFLKLTNQYDNLIIIRSMSKTFGAAGLRVGFCVASERTMNIIKRMQLPFAISIVSMAVAIKLLERYDYVKSVIKEVIQVRDFMFNELKKIEGLTPYRSDANFILVKVEKKNANELANSLEKRGFRVRVWKDNKHLQNFLRITLAPKNVMIEFIDTLNKIMSGDV
ncbi:MAG: histidinol-phosphate transaminase [Candidatus Asgardarchaeia archaeon]